MHNKIPVFKSISEGWAIFKFRPIAPAIYMLVSAIIAFIPTTIVGAIFSQDLAETMYYEVVTAGFIWTYATLIISIFLIMIFSIGLYKMIQGSYYKQKYSFGECLSLSISKAPKVIAWLLLSILLYIVASFVLLLIIGALGYGLYLINETLLATVAIIGYIGLILCSIPLVIAFYFSFLSVVFTSNSCWQSIKYGFSLIFRQGNFWRSIGLYLLMLLIIIAAYCIIGLIGLLLYSVLPTEVMIAIAAIAYLFIVSFFSVFSSGVFIAAYENVTQKEQEVLES